MIYWGIILFVSGILIMLYSQRLADIIFSQPSSKGLGGSLFRILAVFLILGGVVYIILGIKQ